MSPAEALEMATHRGGAAVAGIAAVAGVCGAAGISGTSPGVSALLAVYDGADRSGSAHAVGRAGLPHGQGEAIRMDISDWRKKIDELDEQIVGLISRRAEAARAIGELKRDTMLPVYEPGREQAVFDHVRAVNPGPLPDGEMLHVYERIIDVMRALQRRDG